MKRALQVLDPGPLTTVQDLGRPGLAHLGVGPSGAADRVAARRANALVDNPAEAAVLETTFGGLGLRALGPVEVAVTGAPCGVPETVRLGDGETLRLGRPALGVRTYVAVRGGVDVPPVLGSRSTDLLSGLGPPRLRPGDVVAVGGLPRVRSDAPSWPAPGPDLGLPVLPGPRQDWFVADAYDRLLATAYVVTPDSNRVALRLEGNLLRRSRDDELPSEGLVRGAVQVPPSGQPVLFLADHPVTGGYPVLAVVLDAATDLAAQARPGTRIHFRPSGAR